MTEKVVSFTVSLEVVSARIPTGFSAFWSILARQHPEEYPPTVKIRGSRTRSCLEQTAFSRERSANSLMSILTTHYLTHTLNLPDDGLPRGA